MHELRADLQRLTIHALELVQPLVLNPLSGGWTAEDELRFDEHGQPMILSRPRPNVPSLILAATRQLLDSSDMATLVQRVTDSGVLTQRFVHDGEGRIGHSWQLNAGLLQNFLIRYSELMPDLSWRPITFDQVWRELETYIGSGQAIIEVTSLVHHVRLRGECVELGDDGALHTLTANDKQAIWNRVRRHGPAFLGSTYLQQPLGWDTALRTQCTWKRGERSALNQGRDRHEDVLAALRLLRAGRAGLSVTFAESAGPGAAFAEPGSGLSDLVGWGEPPWGPDLELSREDGSALRDLVANYRMRQNEPRLSFALRRFRLSYERKSPGDQLVDSWIALEGLFGDPEEREDVAGRLAHGIGARLGKDEQARRKLPGKILGYYDVRSRVVHGNLDVPAAQIAKVAQRTDALLRDALVDGLSPTE
jgi:hypothetical protein